ncbi:flavin reductase (DIM6/NTAB) family NADH-FMN oxidoreductase RutF [Hoeflea marina]|uniref:Flavin reductase (DIM6/NTAB) family NADH-FMN oxidoreductase RutF n=1 Tax=Hoeflea marina TaxID=274592 RepID=A0A317PTE5_9HYPH|nr:flavin reductase family protein [Hoeflea marina]PWW03975.1 flavin reductase (DIM6/NTAB) family NADH-FMN oxidoreductase RutF [Hoeflea marina]
MFYGTAGNAHGLPHDPFKAIVSPRPIGWIGTRGRDGSVNLGPYSFFNAISDSPKMVMFSSAGRKDSLRNCEETGVFTASLVGRALAEQMNASSVNAPYGTSEFTFAGLGMSEGQLIDAPFVAEAYAALECRVTDIVPLKGLQGVASESTMVIAQVVGIHIDETVLKDGMIDMALAAPVARLGYRDYADAADVFRMTRPLWPKD